MMNLIGVMSDTHVTAHVRSGLGGVTQKIRNARTLDDLRELAAQHFRGVTLILHAGDMVDAAVIEMLTEFAPVEAVHGNMDPVDVQRRFPAQKIVEIGGFRIGLTHGAGAPMGIAERVRQQFRDVQAIVFGHSHQPLNEMRDGVLLFNPGSPTDRIFAPYNSVGVLELGETISGRIVRV